MKILITGITGRIGGNLAAQLVEQGHRVRGLVWREDQRVEKFKGIDLELIEGNLTKYEDVEKVTDGVDVIYHLGAAFQGGGPFTDNDYFEINLRGTFHMLKAATQQRNLKQFIFASTDALYAKYPPEGMDKPIREDAMPREPRGWYALSKSVGEEMCYGYWRTPPTTYHHLALLPGRRSGRNPRLPPILPEQTQRTSRTQSLMARRRTPPPAQRHERSFLQKTHSRRTRHSTRLYLCIKQNRSRRDTSFNSVDPSPFTWAEAIPYLSQRLGISYQEAILHGAPTHYEYDLTKARDLIGFNPKYDIIRMIEDAIAYREGKTIKRLAHRIGSRWARWKDQTKRK